MSMVSRFRSNARWGPSMVIFLLMAATLGVISAPASSAASGPIRVNAGGAAQTVNGVNWTGCTAVSACGGWVSGGSPNAPTITSTIAGYTADTNEAIHQTEWTGRQGGGSNKAAFTYTFPVQSGQYDVRLHFTELTKTAPGARTFNVKVNDSSFLTNFDIYNQAGGSYKSIVQSTRVNDVNGKITVAFVANIDKAKVDALEVLPVLPATTTTASTTTTSTTITSSTTSTTPSSTTTTAPPALGTTINWTSIASSPYPFVETAGARIERNLYVFGGYQSSNWTQPATKASVYNLDTNSWASIAPVPRGITHAGRAVGGHTIYLVGGVVAEGTGEIYGTTEVWTYNVDTNLWTSFVPLPEARGSGAAVVTGRMLHFFGGVDLNKSPKSEHWVLDLDNPSAGWVASTPFPGGLSHFAALAIGSSIYTFGGETGWDSAAVAQNVVYKFDLASGQWTQLHNMIQALSHVEESTALVGGQVWVFDGQTKPPSGVNTIYVYDIAGDTWVKSSSTVPAWDFASVAVADGATIYHVGGNIDVPSAWKGTINPR